MDDDDSTTGKLPGEMLAKIAGGEPLTAAEQISRNGRELTTERLAREYLESPSVKMARELYDSPAAKLAREYTSSPAQLLAKQFTLGLSPALGGVAMERVEAMRKMLEPSTALIAKLHAIQPLAIDHSNLVAIGAIMPSIDPKVIAAIQGVQPLKIDASLASAVSQAQRTLEEAMRPLGGIGSAIKQFEEQPRAVQISLLATLAGPLVN